ncbi:type I restriction enzyme, R subunit [Brevibacillus sp. IT-7CA2]|uniref:type I restriction-modification system endonuclease n=1 Tax=Brevibacillus sp. IT-7CA2 TaxID=3026436 RepID=UPI0039E02568
MAGNFSFLAIKWPVLSNLGQQAESNLHQDPNTTLIKLRLYAETVAKIIFATERLREPQDNSQDTRLRMLSRQDFFPQELLPVFHTIRKTGNKAVHAYYSSFDEAKDNLYLAFRIGVWLMQTYGQWDFEPEKYVIPKPIELFSAEAKEEMAREYETKLTELQKELELLRQREQTIEEVTQRKVRSQRAADRMLDEAETRIHLIDQQLQQAGWEVNSETLRFSNGTRPEPGRNLAIAEWPVKQGRADYALFCGMQLVGIIEAKRKNKDVVDDLDQARKYAKRLIKKENEVFTGQWGEYKVPFIFATNGRKFLKQLETRSGIWFHDIRKNTNHPRPLMGWFTPDYLLHLLQADQEVAVRKLRDEPLDYLGLREYQLKAIRAVEEAVARDQREVLVAMATGTGKTKTTIGLIYRLIKSKRFNRILFLVDRTALGEQATDAFKESKMENFQAFTEIYELQELDDKTPNRETKVHISTVQGMVNRILYSNDPSVLPTVDQYDCIVVDEAHRGYTLDKEMTDIELEFRDQADYQSKYRMVIDYFDAVKIGLTATPAIHTTDIFGKPVFQYTYREAVIDGYLVDYETPYEFDTILKKNGIKFEKGKEVTYFDRATGELDTAILEDEVNLDVEKFNKQVISDSFNRVVLTELLNYIDPFDLGKTLIFAANDVHANDVVRILKKLLEEIYGEGEIDDRLVMKITGSIDDPQAAIKQFKNETKPNIVVTVDLLTTGIDVPEICNLVFLRRVKSRILYEQMIGRATRLCDKIGKQYFRIFDAVGLYNALDEVNTMKPVAPNPKVKFDQLVQELSSMSDEKAQKKHLDAIISKLQSKKRLVNEEVKEKFKILSGGKTVDELITWLKTAQVEETKQKLVESQRMIDFLDENWGVPAKVLISEDQDKLIEVKRVVKTPEDYLDEFSQFVKDNINRIPAIKLICEKPSDLTKEDLKYLLLELEQNGFKETDLNTAYTQLTNEEIAASIIGFVRRGALGDALISHEERVENAIKKILKIKQWNSAQKRFIENIGKRLKRDKVLDPVAEKAFNMEPFKSEGGFKRAEVIFEGKAQEVLTIINESLYA